MKTTSSNHFNAAGGGRGIFLSRPIYLITLGFVLVIYLDEVIQHVMCFYRPAWNFAIYFRCSMRQQRGGIKGHAMAETPTVRPVRSCTFFLYLLFKHSTIPFITTESL